MLANVPMTYMRPFVTAGNGHESRRWQLPDIEEGQHLSCRMVDVPDDTKGVAFHGPAFASAVYLIPALLAALPCRAPSTSHGEFKRNCVDRIYTRKPVGTLPI